MLLLLLLRICHWASCTSPRGACAQAARESFSSLPSPPLPPGQVPALHAVGCSMAASLAADVGPSQAADSSGPLLVQSGARLMLALLAAEHGTAQQAQHSWDTEWMLQVGLR